MWFLKREYNHSEYIPTTARIEAFSDAVMAIIMTLLVLELKIPESVEVLTNTDLMTALIHLWPKFAGFATSFLVVAIFWVNHHHFFHTLKRANRGLLWWNNLLLFWLSFVPFPTAILGEHLNNQVAVMFYGAVLTAAAGSFFFMYKHSVKSRLFNEGITKKFQRAELLRTVPGLVLYGLSVPLALVSINLSLFIFVLVPCIYFLPQRIVIMGE